MHENAWQVPSLRDERRHARDGRVERTFEQMQHGPRTVWLAEVLDASSGSSIAFVSSSSTEKEMHHLLEFMYLTREAFFSILAFFLASARLSLVSSGLGAKTYGLITPFHSR